MNGEDVNRASDHSASRFVINFWDWPLERAQVYPDCLGIVRSLVKPKRDNLPNYKRRVRDAWWQFEFIAPALRAATVELERVLVIARISKTVQPVFVPNRGVFNEKVVVFAYADDAHFGVLSSAFHYWWTLTHSSSLRTDLNYAPTDCFETFAQPGHDVLVEAAGRALDEFRAPLMIRSNEGLTKTYNRVHSFEETDSEIVRLREFHVALDLAVRNAYGWSDLDLDHGFHETAQGVRYTIGPKARTEVLDRLLELNHERHAAEVAAGSLAKTKRTVPKRKATSATGTDAEPTLFGSLFADDPSGDDA
jgi:ketosteroid isomerase-like protein